jgi:hypothetical protein
MNRNQYLRNLGFDSESSEPWAVKEDCPLSLTVVDNSPLIDLLNRTSERTRLVKSKSVCADARIRRMIRTDSVAWSARCILEKMWVTSFTEYGQLKDLRGEEELVFRLEGYGSVRSFGQDTESTHRHSEWQNKVRNGHPYNSHVRTFDMGCGKDACYEPAIRIK